MKPQRRHTVQNPEDGDIDPDIYTAEQPRQTQTQLRKALHLFLWTLFVFFIIVAFLEPTYTLFPYFFFPQPGALGNSDVKSTATQELLREHHAKQLAELNTNPYLVALQNGYHANAGQDTTPIILCGCGHSGTTVLGMIIGTHSNIHLIPYEPCVFREPQPTRNQLLTDFQAQAVAAGKKRWIEHTPHEVHQLRRILKPGRDVRVILMIRDGRDVAISIQGRQGESFLTGMFRWIFDNLAAEPYFSDPRVYIIHYENLITDTIPELIKLFNFLGEKFNPDVLNYYKRDILLHPGTERVLNRTHIPPSDNHEARRDWQINQPLYDGRGGWKKKMTWPQKVAFKMFAGPLMQRLNCTDDNNW